MNTLMRMKGRSKDNIPSRFDIEQFCSPPHLHIDSGRAPFPAYSLTDEGRTSLLECVKDDIKFLDSYASDLASCDDMANAKFSGMKSHYCHVFMERLFPFIFGELLDRNVHLAIAAELGGPVQYRWMYHFERFFKKLKRKAKNKRYAAESVVQSYLNEEVTYFTEHYFASTIQINSRLTRFDQGERPEYHVHEVPDIFIHVGWPSGQMHDIWLSEEDYQCANSYVLWSCDYFHPFESMLEDYISAKFPNLSAKDLSVKRADEYY